MRIGCLVVGSGRRNCLPLFAAPFRATPVRIGVHLFAVLHFAALHFFARDGQQAVHKIRELVVLCGMFHPHYINSTVAVYKTIDTFEASLKKWSG